MTDIASARVPTRSDQTTRKLLRGGVIAGPIYVVVGAAQMLLRDGYDPTRHSLSLMSNGDLGWIQIASFLITGALVIACAIGMRRVLPRKRAATWGARLLVAHGIGLIAGGLFVADPYDGFPPGTPAGIPTTVSWHGALHGLAGMVTFLSLIAACLAFARLYASLGRRGPAAYAAATGVFYLITTVVLFSGSGQGAAVVAFTVAVVLGWTWISLTSARLLRGDLAEPAGG